jgi:hypothetical protein
MHVAGRSRRVAFLRAAAAALSPGGRLMLSYWDRDDVRGLATTYRIARWVRRVRRDEPPELGDTLAPSFLHRFSHEEIRSELAEAGFRVVYSQPEPVCHVVGVAG